MADYQQLMEGARRAHAAGDGVSAKRFLELAAQSKAASAGPSGADQMRAMGMKSPDPAGANAAANPAARAPTALPGLDAELVGARQGVTFGFGDEINAGVRAGIDALGGDPLRESYQKRLLHERILLDQTRKENPGASVVGEIGGALMVPGKAATSVGNAFVKGGQAGAVYAAGNAEGAPMEVAGEAAKGALIGGVVSGTIGTAIAGGTKAYRSIMGQVAKKPTVEGLQAATKVAYKAVDDAGEVFTPAEMQGMTKAARDVIEESGEYVPETDLQTTAALKVLENTSKRPQTLTQLDNIRKSLWKRLDAAPTEIKIHDAIDAIDDLIQSRAGGSKLMEAARTASALQKKSELLSNAFKLAEDQTKSTGSAGNILNKYKQAVTKIVNNPKKAKWFNPEEIATMQKVIDGSVTEDIMRRIGKMGSSGNGLMMFLNVLGGMQFGAAMLPVTAAGVIAKSAADRSGAANVDALMGKVMGGPAPAPITIPKAVTGLSGYSGGSFSK